MAIDAPFVESIGKVGVEIVAVVSLAGLLYLNFKKDSKITDTNQILSETNSKLSKAIEKQSEAADRQVEASIELSKMTQENTRLTRELLDTVKTNKCEAIDMLKNCSRQNKA